MLSSAYENQSEFEAATISAASHLPNHDSWSIHTVIHACTFPIIIHTYSDTCMYTKESCMRTSDDRFFVYIFVYICVCGCGCLCVCGCQREHECALSHQHAYICTGKYVRAWMCKHTHTFMRNVKIHSHSHAHVYKCPCMYACIDAHTHKYMHMHITVSNSHIPRAMRAHNTHTHTHTFTCACEPANGVPLFGGTCFRSSHGGNNIQ